MNNMQKKQGGGSVVSLIITLAVIGIIAYLAIQYIPQHLESSTVDSILNSIEQDHRTNRISSVNELMRSIDRQLNVNEMTDMKKNFDVTKSGGMYVVKVSYERELNLIYDTKQMKYEKSLTLR
jgi:Tfp pilus assembly protein FimT